MPRIAALCLACCCWARPAAAQHAPPPPIVLTEAPPPELPAPEFPRRPFELVPEFLLGFPSCAEGSIDNQRCDGVGAGAGLAATLLWRPSPFFAFGGNLDVSGFSFHPGSASQLHASSASGYFAGLLGRVYFFDHGLVEPYLELGLGTGGLSTSAEEAGVAYDESSSGLAVRAGGAIEFYLSRHVRLGPAFDWTRLNVSQVQRCGGSRCVNLAEASYGHAVGFSSVSLRLSILLGAGM